MVKVSFALGKVFRYHSWFLGSRLEGRYAMKADVVILGAGSGGEMLASLLGAQGKSVAIIEENLVGGECPFFACMPSKAMLRSAAIRFYAQHTIEVGASSSPLELDDRKKAFASAVNRRDEICDHLQDNAKEQNLVDLGVKVIRGHGQIDSPGVVKIASQEIHYTDLVISTGSVATIPPITGLDFVDYWTTDKALTSDYLPDSLIVIGGGPAGCELAQIYSRFGTKVVLIEPAKNLISKEESLISHELEGFFLREGIEVILGISIKKVTKTDQGKSNLELEDGRVLIADKLLVSTGRVPNTKGLGLDSLGVLVKKSGAIDIDSHCRINGTKNLWACGDVAGIAPLVHTANYQARIIAAGILGGNRVANYEAIPRAVYTSPSIASVGMSFKDALAAGFCAITSAFDLKNTSRNAVDGGNGGLLILTADKKSRTLIGAAAIGPHADEWISEAVLAIRAKVSLDILADVVHAFPTYGEAYEQPIRDLLAACSNESPAH